MSQPLSPLRRGLAHVGMIKAMTEEGIPIDMVGGTSMGAFIGALWAEERQYVPFTRRAREWAMVSFYFHFVNDVRALSGNAGSMFNLMCVLNFIWHDVPGDLIQRLSTTLETKYSGSFLDLH